MNFITPAAALVIAECSATHAFCEKERKEEHCSHVGAQCIRTVNVLGASSVAPRVGNELALNNGNSAVTPG